MEDFLRYKTESLVSQDAQTGVNRRLDPTPAVGLEIAVSIGFRQTPEHEQHRNVRAKTQAGEGWNSRH
jgi:hypothetical protein